VGFGWGKIDLAVPNPHRLEACATKLLDRRRFYVADTFTGFRHSVDASQKPGGHVRTRVKQWGNSAAVRTPASVMHAARLGLGDVVQVREEAGRIIIESVRQETCDLRKLLDRITSKNRHERVDFGRVAGKGVW
jgi:antitoxin MazE